MNESWTSCWICGKGISEENPSSGFWIESLIPRKQDEEEYAAYKIKTHLDSSDSWFYLCVSCEDDLKLRLTRLIHKFEKERKTQKSGDC